MRQLAVVLPQLLLLQQYNLGGVRYRQPQPPHVLCLPHQLQYASVKVDQQGACCVCEG